MATTPTNLPVPSESPRDLKFNAGKIDEFVTSLALKYVDRLGGEHYTIEGLRQIAQQAIAAFGWVPMDSFQDGATLTLPNQVLRWKLPDGDGDYYRWDGVFPKIVPAASTPESTGGIGAGAWLSVGDAALRTMLASTTGTDLIGMPAGGTLADTIHTVSVEQWSHLVGVDNDWSLAIQAAIDYMSAAGGGIVELGAKTYRAANLILKPRVVLQGQTRETTMIKAPDGWSGNAVIMGEGYLTYKADSAKKVVPGCFSSGARNVTIHGNADNFAGTPAKDYGCGLLHAGENMIIENIKIIYTPSVGLVTLNWGGDRELYQSIDPDRGWGHIGIHRGIRIQFCGNDCWHCESQDYYIDDVEIVGAGNGYTSDQDPRSFWEPTERVSNFRVWRNVDIGFMHCYGNFNGYGFIAGGNTSTFFIRIKYSELIVESCLIGAWFKPSSYVQGGKLDFHQISQHMQVKLHSMAPRPPAIIIECNNTKVSDFGSIQGIQSDAPGENEGYSGIGLYLSGQFNIIGCFTFVRNPESSTSYPGTGLFISGQQHVIESGSIRGCYGTDSNKSPGSAIVYQSGNHRLNCDVGYGNIGFRYVAGTPEGRVHNMGELKEWQRGFESASIQDRSMFELSSASGSNHMTIRGGAGAISNSSTDDQTVTITGLALPYIPSSFEVIPHLSIDAFLGSSKYPRASHITYVPNLSSTSKMVFVVRLQNNDSPMQVSVGARIN